MAAEQIPQHGVNGINHATTGVEETLGVPELLPDMFAVKSVDADKHRRNGRHKLARLPNQIIGVESSFKTWDWRLRSPPTRRNAAGWSCSPAAAG